MPEAMTDDALTLTAECSERTRAGHGGIYDVSFKRADGTPIAEFRGHSRIVDGTWVRTQGQTRRV